MKIAAVLVLSIAIAPTLAHPITGVEPRDISGEQQSVGKAVTKALTDIFRREPEPLFNVRDFVDDLEARGFDVRNTEDSLKARDFDDVLEARDLVKRGKGGKGGGSRSQHHCAYKSCKKSKDQCTEHYWECSGEGTLTHSSQKILTGKACESNCRDTADGKLYKCGRKQPDEC